MLGLRFQLTPAQVDVLLIMSYCERPIVRLSDGRVVEGIPLELSDYPQFLNSAQALIRKGLLKHDGEKWVVTDEGRAVASLVYKKAKEIVNWAERPYSLVNELTPAEKEATEK